MLLRTLQSGLSRGLNRSSADRFSTSRNVVCFRTQQQRVEKDSRCKRSVTICRSADATVQPGTAAAATSTTLYVTQLDNAIKGDQLTSHFKAQPGFESAFIMDVDDEDGRQQHLGFVQFSNAEAAAAAQKALDGSELSQQRIRVRSQRGGKAGSGDTGSQGADQAAAQPSAAEPSPPSTPQAADPATTTEAVSKTTTPDISTTSSSSTTTPSAASGSNDSQSSSEQAPSPQDAPAAGPEGADEEKAAATAATSRSKAYRQRQKQNLPPPSSSTLFVPNLRQKTTKEELAEHFRDQPGVEAVFVRVAMGRRYDGYVQFTSPENATAAMQALAGTELNSKPLRMLIHEGPGRKRTRAPEAAATADSASGADGAAEQLKPQPKQQRKQPQTQGSSKAASTTASDDAAQLEASSSDSSSSSTQEASSSSSSSRKKVRGETRGQSFSVKVSNLAWSTTRDSLEAHFKDCKDYKTCVTIPNAEGRPSGIGFVRFSTAAGAQAAMEAKQESELDGRAIKVTLQEQRPAKPAAAADGGSGGRAAWALQVFNLAYDATEQDLLDHFGGCKGFQGAFIATGRDNRPSGTGFVVFDSEDAQTAAYKAKQGTELVGRTVYLRSTRPGRVEAAGEGSSAADTAAAATAAAEAPAATASSADSNTQPSALLLLGLPPSFTWREVTGLCSFFGGVRNVTRTRSDWKSGSSTGAAADAGETGGPDLARQGQPCFVNMDSVEAVGRAVAALNGHTVQGHKLVAGFAPRKKAVAGKQQNNAE